MGKYGEYGVAYPRYIRGELDEGNSKRYPFEYPIVNPCSSKEEAIEEAEDMNKYMFGDAVPFENRELRKEVDWYYILEHQIK